ncbi:MULTISPECIES: VOC family protein [Protofrankia]|uniref:VOC family protein n=1 Tax=Protofrankia TaxID=2994361 RepID=UPI001040F235|nr:MULTISPECIES: VOC family protein [Protofrankia]
MLTHARWTHVALPSSDIDASIDFYTTMTPLVVVATRKDEAGRSAWLSNDQQWQDPFVLVLAEFTAERGHRQPTMTPFAHIGIEVADRAEVDAVAGRARAAGCLHWEPQDMPDPVGYICAVTDPDGNVIEFSHNQRVFQTIRELWGPSGRRGTSGWASPPRDDSHPPIARNGAR